MHHIYIIQNNVNFKLYVGQTNDIARRWVEHRSYAKSNSKPNHPLYNSIRKYGIDNFGIAILETFASLEEANEAEEFWIEFFNSCDRKLGYNLYLGGDNREISDETRERMSIANSGENNGFYGKTHSKETRDNLSAAHIGMEASSEVRQKMSNSRKGEKNGMHGKTHTPEARQKIAEARREGMKNRKRDEKGRLVKVS